MCGKILTNLLLNTPTQEERVEDGDTARRGAIMKIYK